MQSKFATTFDFFIFRKMAVVGKIIGPTATDWTVRV